MKILNLLLTLFIISSCAIAPRSINELDVKGMNYLTNLPIESSAYDNTKKGQVVLFVSSVCPCSASFESEIEKLNKDYGTQFNFIGIHSNLEERFDDAKEYFKYVNFPIPVIRDDKHYYANLYGALKTPHAFIISSSGEILYQGGIGASSNGNDHTQELPLRMALEQISLGLPVKTPLNPVFGCSISR